MVWGAAPRAAPAVRTRACRAAVLPPGVPRDAASAAPARVATDAAAPRALRAVAAAGATADHARRRWRSAPSGASVLAGVAAVAVATLACAVVACCTLIWTCTSPAQCSRHAATSCCWTTSTVAAPATVASHVVNAPRSGRAGGGGSAPTSPPARLHAVGRLLDDLPRVDVDARCRHASWYCHTSWLKYMVLVALAVSAAEIAVASWVASARCDAICTRVVPMQNATHPSWVWTISWIVALVF